MPTSTPLSSSFRDPAGQVFRRSGQLLRQVNRCYEREYAQLMGSGLYENLQSEGLLISHREAELGLAMTEEAYKVLAPQEVDFISHPWEWCFSQLKDAALATLKIQEIALQHGMILKDANAFNIQFHGGRPVLIDTLSFALYREGEPWNAYRQFCQHFLAPLVLISHCDYRLLKLMRSYVDGIPLDLTSSLLPKRTWLKYSLLAHIHLHARAQSRYADGEITQSSKNVRVSALGLRALTDSLRVCVDGLRWRPKATQWGEYYQDTNYSDAAMDHKTGLVDHFLSQISDPGILLDLGANTGKFSELGLKFGRPVVAMDIDELAVEQCYLRLRNQGPSTMLPLVQDLSNPSPAIGWTLRERMSLLDRGPAKIVMALALIHHLAISNNVPLGQCAEFFARLGDHLIIEFVPKSDSQVQRLLQSREDIFENYGSAGFEEAFRPFFTIENSEPVEGSDRQLYLMARITTANQ